MPVNSKLENGSIKLSDANVVCRVKESPILDAIDINHYVMPGLHMLIGKRNNGLNNLMAEVQAVAESFAPAYAKAKKNVAKIPLVLQEAQEDLARFNTIHREYKKDLKE
jgi:hypothetical protein